MIDTALIAVSAVILLVAAWKAVLLAHGAPGRERPIWLGLTVLLLLSATARTIAATSYSRALGVDLPLGIMLTLLGNPIVIVIVLTIIHPILRTYRNAERRRQESDEAFLRSLATSRDPLGVIDMAGRYLYVNDAGCELFRYRRDQILNHDFREFMAGVEPGPHDTVHRALETGAAQVEREVLRGDGSRLTIECDLVALGDGRTLFVGRDLTPRREAEAARIRAERLEAIRTLSSIIGADFADTLSFAKSSLDLTAEFGSERVPVDAPIAAITRALALMSEFSALSTQASDSYETPPSAIDIRPIVREAVEQAAALHADHTRLEFSDTASPLMVTADPVDVARVCSGLIANACAAIDESLSAQPAGTFTGRIAVLVKAGGSAAPHEVEIIVDDNGGALSAEVRAHMFEPLFHDLSRRLGLGTTHALVLRLGGSMTVQRRPDGGSTVTARLPATTEQRA